MEESAAVPEARVRNRRIVLVVFLGIALAATIGFGYLLQSYHEIFVQLGMAEKLPFVLSAGIAVSDVLFPWGWIVPAVACAGLSILALKGRLDGAAVPVCCLSGAWWLFMALAAVGAWSALTTVHQSLSG